jgi:hypothetical protein
MRWRGNRKTVSETLKYLGRSDYSALKDNLDKEPVIEIEDQHTISGFEE